MSDARRVFLLQIAFPDGAVVQLPAGGALERDLVATCTAAIVGKGVGWFKSEAHVRAAISAGISEALTDLKRESVQAVGTVQVRG